MTYKVGDIVRVHRGDGVAFPARLAYVGCGAVLYRVLPLDETAPDQWVFEREIDGTFNDKADCETRHPKSGGVSKPMEGAMLVKEIMSPKVEWIGPDLPVREAAKKMRDLDVGSLPIEEGDNVIGMITDRDIVCRTVAEGRDPAKTKVGDVMSKGVTWCFDDQDVTDAAHLMEDNQLHRLPVLNHDKRLVGIVALADLALHSSHELSGEVVEAVSRHTH